MKHLPWLSLALVSVALLLASVALKDREAAVCAAWISGGLFSFSGGIRRVGRKT